MIENDECFSNKCSRVGANSQTGRPAEAQLSSAPGRIFPRLSSSPSPGRACTWWPLSARGHLPLMRQPEHSPTTLRVAEATVRWHCHKHAEVEATGHAKYL